MHFRTLLYKTTHFLVLAHQKVGGFFKKKGKKRKKMLKKHEKTWKTAKNSVFQNPSTHFRVLGEGSKNRFWSKRFHCSKSKKCHPLFGVKAYFFRQFFAKNQWKLKKIEKNREKVLISKKCHPLFGVSTFSEAITPKSGW